MIDLFQKLLDGFEALRPGLARECKERAVLTRALGGYRTPSNHHLRRALRLSWVRAASTVVDHWGEWARRDPNRPGAREMLDFVGSFDAARREVITVACNTDSGEDIGESPIDGFLDAILEDLAQHLKDGTGGTGRETVRVSLGPTLEKLTRLTAAEIPSRIIADAKDGFSVGPGERRDFGQLLFDEFARVLQDPKYYPEAAGSVPVVIAEIHHKANQILHDNMCDQLAEFATRQADEIRVQVEKALARLSVTWMQETLRENHAEVIKGIRDIQEGIDDIRASSLLGPDVAAATVSIIDEHTPARDRTVVFAGLLSRPETASVMDDIADKVSRSVSRSDEENAIVPLVWDLAESLRREKAASDYARTAAWDTLDHNVVGGVLIIAEGMGKDIEPDDRFLSAADGRGWLEPNGPLDDLMDMRAKERVDALRANAIPITYETRFVFECILRSKPLLVVVARHRSTLEPAVENLLTFLEGQGVPCLHHDGAPLVSQGLDRFIGALIVDDPTALPNPYRGLDYYQIDDAEAYHGRKPEAAQAHAYIAEALEEGRGLFLGITGPSGCGKSSFLRARVAAEAKSGLGLEPIELRPTDFRLPGEAKVRTLPHLCEEIAACIEAIPPEELVGENAMFRKVHIPKFKTWLGNSLCSTGKPGFVICIDQFEEILDDLSEGVHEGEWRALFEILDHLVESHRCPVVLTIEDSRRESFERLSEELGMKNAKLVELPDSDEDFYRAIMRKPFENIGIDLGEDIVDALLDEVDQHRNDAGSSSSPLPLLSLRLEALFREISPKAPVLPDTSNLSRDFDRIHVTRDELKNQSLALGAMIADLAETAWKVGGGGETLIDVGFFLRPLIRLSIDQDNPDDAKLVLQTVGGRGMDAERRLEAEFKRRRVLVPAGGGLRLVHESVIRRWPQAKNWFKSEREQLLKESAFRADAMRWVDGDRPPVKGMDSEQIEIAAQLLFAHLREWSLRDLPPMDPETIALREYAIAVFKTSRCPRAMVNSDDPGKSHVHLAATYGFDDLLEEFFCLDPDAIDLRAKNRRHTPLSRACWSHLSTARLLLEKGADTDAVDDRGFCALDSAVWGEQDEIVELLLDHVNPDDWNDTRMNPLCGAAARGRIDLAEKLAAKGFRHDQPSREGWTPLHAAACKNDLAVFRYFLLRGDLNSRWRRGSQTVVSESPKDGNDDRGADDETRYILSRTPFHMAAFNGHIELVRFLLSRKDAYEILETPMETGETPLILAARTHKYRTVSLLLKAMADPNAKTDTPWGPEYNALHHALADYDSQGAAASGHLKRVSRETALAILTCAELDVSAATADGKTAWQMAMGIPEVQRAIEAHPNLSDDAKEKMREQLRARALSVRQGELIDAVINDKKDVFETLLDSFRAGDNVDGTKVIEGSPKQLGDLLLEKGWTDVLSLLIRDGWLDPWRREHLYSGLLLAAHRCKASDVAALITERMPKSVPGPILVPLLVDLRGDTPTIDDPEGELQKALLNGAETPDLNEVLFYAARSGNVGLYRSVAEAGADEETQDDWGRTARETGSRFLQKELGTGPSDAIADTPDLFHPLTEGWMRLNDASLVERLKPDNDLKWDDKVDVKERALPFYPGARLIVAKHADWPQPSQFLYWLERDGDLFRLNGTSPPIHEFNAKKTLDVSGGNAVEYLKFFGFFVRGEEGPFYIVDHPASAYLPDSFTPQSKDKTLSVVFARVFRGTRAFGTSEDGKHRISALIYYSNAMFGADFLVHPTGMVEMKEDWPLIADLPCKVEAPL